MKNKWPFGINYFCQLILLFGLLFLLFMDLTTLFILFIGPTVLFQLIFTFIYNTFVGTLPQLIGFIRFGEPVPHG